ncbi:hypothetical protein HY449_01290 [Candidatus Pacearchaeota archaeon]|nr:hypothetical protein [Candidatus Pacearchaeota archaeon]
MITINDKDINNFWFAVFVLSACFFASFSKKENGRALVNHRRHEREFIEDEGDLNSYSNWIDNYQNWLRQFSR